MILVVALPKAWVRQGLPNRHKSDQRKNQENVKITLEVIELFFVRSGLKINREKIYLSIFGASLGCPRFVDTLGKNFVLNSNYWVSNLINV